MCLTQLNIPTKLVNTVFSFSSASIKLRSRKNEISSF